MANILSLFSLFAFTCLTVSSQEIFSSFKWINFTFSSVEDYNNYMNSSHYESCMPAGIKLDSMGNIYISIPRWKEGVPATLNRYMGVSNGIAMFSPFPSFAGNAVGSAEALQSVLGFEVDLDDNIWVLDQGRVNNVYIEGSLKVNKYNPKGDLIDYYDLSTVAFGNTSFLNDLVLDIDNGFMYIADSGIPIQPNAPMRPGLIVVNIITKEMHRVLDRDPSVMPDPSLWVTVNGSRALELGPMQTGADGIGLSCDKRTVFYTPLTSRTIYAISAKALQEDQVELASNVINVGYKYSASDGIICSQNGHLYLTAIELNAILMQPYITPYARGYELNKFIEILADYRLVWPDTLGFDNNNKKIYAVANQLMNFEQDRINFTDPVYGDANFYIWSVYVNDRSYLYKCSFSSASSDSDDFPTWAIILVVVVALVVVAIIVCAVKSYLVRRKKQQGFL